MRERALGMYCKEEYGQSVSCWWRNTERIYRFIFEMKVTGIHGGDDTKRQVAEAVASHPMEQGY